MCIRDSQRVITENLGSFDDYLTKCIEDAVLKVKRGDPYLTISGELLEGIQEATAKEGVGEAAAE